MTDLAKFLTEIREAFLITRRVLAGGPCSDVEYTFDRLANCVRIAHESTGFRVGQKVKLKKRFVVPRLTKDGSGHGWWIYNPSFFAGAVAEVRAIEIGSDGPPSILVRFDEERYWGWKSDAAGRHGPKDPDPSMDTYDLTQHDAKRDGRGCFSFDPTLFDPA